MKLEYARVFDVSLENAKVTDLKNIEIVGDDVMKNGQVVNVEGYGEINLSDKNVHIQPMDSNSAKTFYAPKKRGRQTYSHEILVGAVTRLRAGEKVRDVEYETRISGAYLRKLMVGDIRPEVLEDALAALETAETTEV